VLVVCILLVPDASALIVMLMLGNFLRECGVTERLLKSAQNEVINIVTIFLGTSVGLTMQGGRFLRQETLMIIVLGVVAFGFSTAGGVIAAKIMNWLSPKNPVNPLIGFAGGRPEIRSQQLSSYACHGAQRGGSDWHGAGRRILHGDTTLKFSVC
jgi:Na+-transporting methylmalonyl-CoA/oxaloacetate decarboxylase beta subunit